MNRMKYFVILAALISISEAGCPSMCNCSDSSVLCIEKELESVPSFESLLNDPIIIDLSGNKINMIDSDDFSFDKSDRVLEIYLNNTELLDIDSEAFDELENLQELYLGENLLNSIPESLIQDLPNMIVLDISNNHFGGSMPKIISQSLEVLALANSKVTSIPDDTLKYLPNLKMLLLQQNNIKSLNPSVFESVNKNSFFVKISYNIWECSCENIELFEYLEGKNFIDTSEPYQCVTSDGQYINVYSKGTIDGFKKKCFNIPIRSQVTKDLTTFKENRYISKEDGLQNDTSNADKPYSLIKENNATLGKSDKRKVEERDNSVEETYETEYPLVEDYDIVVKEINYTRDGIQITEFDTPVEPKLIYNINVSAFIAILCSFVIGVIFGFCLNQFATSTRYRSLETSDSRTKLILP